MLETAAALAPSETPSIVDLVSPKSKLPAWMVAPLDIEVQERTREATDVEVAPVVYRNLRTREETQTATAAAAAAAVASPASGAPSISNTAAMPVTGQSPHSPLDIRANTFWYAREFFHHSYVYLWWLFLPKWMSGFWELFGFGYFGGLLFTLLFLAAGVLGYGYVRAILDWSVASDDPQQQASFNSTSVLSILQSSPSRAPAALAPPPARPATTLSLNAHGPAVVGNSSLKIYHLPACVWVGKISPQHSLHFASPLLANAEGYRPCKVCKP
jgi:hypothetical protein